LDRSNYDSLLLGWATLEDGETKIPENLLGAEFGFSNYINGTAVINA
jgi:hypothetical protein